MKNSEHLEIKSGDIHITWNLDNSLINFKDAR